MHVGKYELNALKFQKVQAPLLSLFQRFLTEIC